MDSKSAESFKEIQSSIPSATEKKISREYAETSEQFPSGEENRHSQKPSQLVKGGPNHCNDSNSASQSTESLSRIKMAGKHDIIFGRGKGFHMHSGNQRMLAIVSQYKAAYCSLKRREKRGFVERVHREIVKNGARFLIKISDLDDEDTVSGEDSSSSDGGSCWYKEADLEIARMKVSNALRCRKTLKASESDVSNELKREASMSRKKPVKRRKLAQHNSQDAVEAKASSAVPSHAIHEEESGASISDSMASQGASTVSSLLSSQALPDLLSGTSNCGLGLSNVPSMASNALMQQSLALGMHPSLFSLNQLYPSAIVNGNPLALGHTMLPSLSMTAAAQALQQRNMYLELLQRQELESLSRSAVLNGILAQVEQSHMYATGARATNGTSTNP